MLLLCLPTVARELTVLDLTGTTGYAPSRRSPTPLSVTAISGRRIGPEPYPIPLQITIVRVEPKEVGRYDEFALEIELKNIGSRPFYFPVSRNFPEVEHDGNRGRREATVFLHFEDPPQGIDVDSVGLLAGSPSVPGSLKRLNSGDIVRVRVKGDLEDASKLMSPGQRKVTFRAGYSEWTLKDDRFAIENISRKVMSRDTVTLTLK